MGSGQVLMVRVCLWSIQGQVCVWSSPVGVQLVYGCSMGLVRVWLGSGQDWVGVRFRVLLGSDKGPVEVGVQLRLGQGQFQSDQGSVRVKSGFESGISFLERILTMPTP